MRWWNVDIGDPEVVLWGSPIELGAQDRKNLLELVQESVLADSGLLSETRNRLGLTYRTRESLDNQDVALTAVLPGFQSVRDPQAGR